MKEYLLRQSYAACRGISGLPTHQPWRLNSLVTSIQHPPSSIRLRSSQATTGIVPTASDDEPQGRSVSRLESYAPLALDPKYAVSGIVTDLSTTRPIPLNAPEPPHPLAWPSEESLNPKDWDFRYLFSLGKAYLALYKTGVKNVWNNWTTMKQIKERLKGTGLNAAALDPESPKLSYNEYELILRTRRDLRKFIPFGLIFIICGEFTPLLIVALGSKVVPGTCVIPKQQENDIQKMLRRFEIYEQKSAELRHGIDTSKSISEKQELTTDTTKSQQSIDLLKLYRYGFYPRPTESQIPILRSYLIASARSKLAQHGTELLAEATMISREGGWTKRSPQDMFEWGTKYSLNALLDWTRNAKAQGKELVSEEMKEALLPAFEEATHALLYETDWSKIPVEERWRQAVNVGDSKPL
ncbi:hypothetical protein LTR64_001331 [Lithohypha guttulata]|uniref:uncharacterized protein n=1 Tax=Lithohypha guttulata TaxID=1690604 RepID=UPI002DE14231|nr:hypothetical protein LTR51_003525 [Lithohypha guttulata]